MRRRPGRHCRPPWRPVSRAGCRRRCGRRRGWVRTLLGLWTRCPAGTSAPPRHGSSARRQSHLAGHSSIIWKILLQISGEWKIFERDVMQLLIPSHLSPCKAFYLKLCAILNQLYLYDIKANCVSRHFLRVLARVGKNKSGTSCALFCRLYNLVTS